MRSLPTEAGWMSLGMAVAGSRLSLSPIAAGVRISTADAGFIQIAAGIGCQITHGAGRHSITDAGSSTRSLAGAGDLTASGVRHGFAGDKMGIIVVGLRCRGAQDLLPGLASHSTVILQDTIFLLD